MLRLQEMPVGAGGGLPSEGLSLPLSQVEVPPDESADAILLLVANLFAKSNFSVKVWNVATRPSPNGRSVSGPQNKTLIPRLPGSARVGEAAVSTVVDDRP